MRLFMLLLLAFPAILELVSAAPTNSGEVTSNLPDVETTEDSGEVTTNPPDVETTEDSGEVTTNPPDVETTEDSSETEAPDSSGGPTTNGIHALTMSSCLVLISLLVGQRY